MNTSVLVQELKPLMDNARKRRKVFVKRLWALYHALIGDATTEKRPARAEALFAHASMVASLLDRCGGSDADVLAAMDDARVAGLA